MLRPIESNLSLYNVENKASQVKDPNAHQYQAMQQNEMDKKAQIQSQTVQPTEKTEGGTKVRERKEDRERNREEKRKREKISRASTVDESGKTSTNQEGSGLNFLA